MYNVSPCASRLTIRHIVRYNIFISDLGVNGFAARAIGSDAPRLALAMASKALSNPESQHTQNLVFILVSWLLLRQDLSPADVLRVLAPAQCLGAKPLNVQTRVRKQRNRSVHTASCWLCGLRHLPQACARLDKAHAPGGMIQEVSPEDKYVKANSIVHG
jgi:hypothetical protein